MRLRISDCGLGIGIGAARVSKRPSVGGTLLSRWTAPLRSRLGMSRLGMLCVAALLAAGMGAQCHAANSLSDDFSADSGLWTDWADTFNDPQTPTRTGAEGNPTPSCAEGDHRLVVSNQGFQYVGRTLEIACDMKTTHPIPSQQITALQLLKSPTPTGAGDFLGGLQMGGPDHSVAPNMVYCSVKWDNGGTETDESSGWIGVPSTAGWHRGAIRIRPDRIVEFYLDGVLKYTSTHPILGGFDGSLAVTFSAGRPSFYDNALVQELPGYVWSKSTGSMGTARKFHTATLLQNGKVLVAGGVNDSGNPALATAELYDPATGTWSATGNLNTARRSAAAVLLANGKVFVCGGDGGAGGPGRTATAELYDPVTGTWSTSGAMANARSGHLVVRLANGMALVLGGGTSNDTVELYDPATGTWSPTGNTITAHDSPNATLLANGKVLVGGAGLANTACELYDPAAGTWSATGSMAARVGGHAPILLADGRVLASGGDWSGAPTATCEIYNASAGTWSNTGSLPFTATWHQATLLPNGKVLIEGSAGTGSAKSAVFDPAGGTWTATSDMGFARLAHRATLLPNGQVLVTGGAAAETGPALSACELLSYAAGSWSGTASMSVERCGHTPTLLPNGKVLVAAGNGVGGTYPASGELYSPSLGTWSSGGAMAQGRSGHTAAVLNNGKVLAAGGVGSGPTYFDTVELYDPSSNTSCRET